MRSTHGELAPGRTMRKMPRIGLMGLLWLLVTLAAGVAAATNLGEVGAIFRVVKSGRPPYVLAALGVQILFMLNMARFYVTTFEAGGLQARTPRFLLLTSASYFVNLVSNTTGLAGIGIYISEARRTDQSLARVSAAYMVVYALGYAAFFIVLGFALVLLYLRGSLTAAEVIASAIIFAFFCGVGVVVGAGLRSRDALEGALLFLVRPVNTVTRLIMHREVAPAAAIRDTAIGLYDAVADMKRRPLRFVVPFLHAVAVELVSALLFFVLARALNANIGFEVALVGYVLSLLFSLVAITPGGVGFVEASLAVILVSFGLPESKAIALALAFRLFDFWLPVVVGALSVSLVGRSRQEVTA